MFYVKSGICLEDTVSTETGTRSVLSHLDFQIYAALTVGVEKWSRSKGFTFAPSAVSY